MSKEDQAAFDTLETRLKTILPPAYQETYEEVQPVSMGSAGLIYAADGRVAWNEIWKTFCDLAMAGGPPHKGTLLEPGTQEEIAAQTGRYRQVVEEICRGIHLVTGLEAAPSRTPGWVRVECPSAAMAGWLVRAIEMENVSCWLEGAVIYLPAGPGYRLEKEIKNVVTVIAKTCHYWVDHMPVEQRDAIGALFLALEKEEPLLQSGREAKLQWLGISCPGIRSAIWMMRMMVASNVLSRREGTTVFVPSDSDAVSRLARVERVARETGIL